MFTKPMLAAKLEDVEALKYPLIASPKIDGIRCLCHPTLGIVTRSFKKVPNRHIAETLTRVLLPGMDGEIIVGDNFSDSTSGIMSRDGKPDFTYHVFDYVPHALKQPYFQRIHDLQCVLEESTIDSRDAGIVKLVVTKSVRSINELNDYEDECLDLGYEGAMVRDPHGAYKCGRSTFREGGLIKVVRYEDSEAIITGFTELNHNLNEQEKDNFGRSKRSSKKEGKVGDNTLGNFQVKDVKTGVAFEIGTGKGLTQVLRKAIWDDRQSYLGRVVKYKFKPYGVVDKPRTPIWLGFRSSLDM